MLSRHGYSHAVKTTYVACGCEKKIWVMATVWIRRKKKIPTHQIFVFFLHSLFLVNYAVHYKTNKLEMIKRKKFKQLWCCMTILLYPSYCKSNRWTIFCDMASCTDPSRGLLSSSFQQVITCFSLTIAKKSSIPALPFSKLYFAFSAFVFH